MKKLIVCVALIGMLLSGCGASSSAMNGRFVQVESTGAYSILVDTETNVMYLRYYVGYKYGITVLLNADGTPMLWGE